MTTRRTPVIGVMGGGEAPRPIAELAAELGGALAKEGWIVLNGGRDAGVMAAVSRGASQAGGVVVGVLPDRDLTRASPHLTIPIRTGLGEGRNIVNILSSDVVIALPGRAGTLSEIDLALQNHKPLLLVGWDAPPTSFGGQALESLQTVDEVMSRIGALLPTLDL
ncbi:MAG: TIGR00725 family protein [Candidatus Neomarinimicrobiota bacterium]